MTGTLQSFSSLSPTHRTHDVAVKALRELHDYLADWAKIISRVDDNVIYIDCKQLADCCRPHNSNNDGASTDALRIVLHAIQLVSELDRKEEQVVIKCIPEK